MLHNRNLGFLLRVFGVLVIAILSGCHDPIVYRDDVSGSNDHSFMVIADPQFGFFTNNKDFVKETELLEKAIERANRLKPAYVVICGDLVNRPGDKRQISELFRICKKLDSTIPLFFVSGNHDILNDPTIESVELYRSTFGDDRYSFSNNNCYGIVLNSTILCSQNEFSEQESAKQFKWLKEELEKISARQPDHIFVFLHHPLFLENPVEDDSYFNVPSKWRTVYLQLLDKYNVTAIFAGHYHRNSYGKCNQTEMVTTASVGRPLGEDPSGFRVVEVSGDNIKHQYYVLDEVDGHRREAFENNGIDDSYPKDNFLVLGPISPNLLDADKFISDLKAGVFQDDPWSSRWVFPDGTELKWSLAEKGNPDSLSIDAEVVQTAGGEFLDRSSIYALQANVHSEAEQLGRLYCDRKNIHSIFVNGEQISRDMVSLKKGDNSLVLLYHCRIKDVSKAHSGCFFRMLNAYTGKRLESISYRPLKANNDLNDYNKSALKIPVKTAGELEITVKDKATGATLACRVYLRNSRSEPRLSGDCPDCFKHFTCDGTVKMTLPPGKYSYQIEAGKEHYTLTGSIDVLDGKKKILVIELERFADMTSDHWYAGDLHNHVSVEDMPLMMKAENIHISYVPWWWINPPMGRTANKTLLEYDPLLKLADDRFVYLRAGEDERNDGTMIYFGLPESLPIKNADWAFPPITQFVEQVMDIPGVWIHADHMFWWELPAWLACGRLDSVEVINNNFTREGFNDTEAWGKARDKNKYPPPFGNAVYQQDVYYHILNCGFRIPPAGGSAACVGGEPFGYNRVYVNVEGKLSWEKWWDGLRDGRCFVTNGPLLRVKANGYLPGHIFTVAENQSLSIDFDVDLAARDKITAIEVISNGDVVLSVPFEELARTGRINGIELNESGWFLIRALTDNPDTYRFAMTGPYYIENTSGQRHISKSSSEFFLNWARQASKRSAGSDPTKNAIGRDYHNRSIKFWQELSMQANAE